MFHLRFRRNFWNTVSWCCVVVMLLGLYTFLAPPPAPTPARRGPRRESVAQRKAKITSPKAKSDVRASARRLPEVKETLQRGRFGGVFGHSVVVDHLAYGTQAMTVVLQEHSPDVVVATDYVHRVTPPPRLVTGEMNSSRPLEEPRLLQVRDYFTYLKTPQAGCRKLVNMGGLHRCGDMTDELIDGSKVVCMDPALGLPPAPDSRTCLALSFGINVDSSFDEALARFHCEVHMFDLINHKPARLLNQYKHAHFHNVGLSDARRQHYYLNTQQEIPLDSISGILVNDTFIGRPLNILKIDIEDAEWRVLEKMVQEPIMDIIGQIAIEIHAMDLKNLTSQEGLAYVRQRYDVLKALEGRGFQKVAYWDNTWSNTYNDPSGVVYNTCGEIHYVNSNWYNGTFKQHFKDIGFEFI